MRPLRLILLATLLGTAACSSGSSNTPDPLTVMVQDNSFSPGTKAITTGQTITWKWSGSNSHNISFTGGPSSPTQIAGTYARTFTEAGTYQYTCVVHGAAMSGSVTVTAPASGVTGAF